MRTRSRSQRSESMMRARMASADDCFARFEGRFESWVHRSGRGSGGHPGGRARLRGLPPTSTSCACPSPPPTPPPSPALCAADEPDLSGGRRGQLRPAWERRHAGPTGPVMVHHPCGRMCAAEGLHHVAAWRHGTAQRTPEHKSWAARARHEVTIESLTYKFIHPIHPCGFFIRQSCVCVCGCGSFCWV